MRLVTLKSPSRDGALHVLSSDLARIEDATDIAPNLRSALEDWAQIEPRLRARSAALEAGRLAGQPFDPATAAAPLPRCFQWLDGSAFSTHGMLMSRAFNVPPEKHAVPWPLMYQGAGDNFLGAGDPVALPSEDDNIDFEAEIGVVVDDVPMGVSAEHALRHVKLLVLLNDVSLRRHAAPEMDVGFGFIQAKPSSSFAPVAVTPDCLGAAWHDGRLHLPVSIALNGAWFGNPNAGAMDYGFDELISFAARRRPLGAGTIVGSGTVSNADYAAVGSGCITERRAIEVIAHGAPKTPFMKFGDTVRMEVLNADGSSVFGAIDQAMTQAI